MNKDKLKKAFSHAANAGLAFAGGAAFLTVPLFGITMVALTGPGLPLGQTLTSLPIEIQAVTAGMMAASAAVGSVGYARLIGDAPGPQKGKLAHAFNLMAVTLGASTALVGAITLGQGDITPMSLALTAGGAGMFYAGYSRQFGQHKSFPAPGVK